MRWQNIRPALPPFAAIRICWLGLTALLLIAGCARHPWQKPLAGGVRSATLQLYKTIWRQQASCGNCLDSNIRIFFNNRLINRAAEGYLMLMEPGYIKFIADNPLGQPQLALTSDGTRFDFLSVADRLFMDGKVAAFGKAHDLPSAVISGAVWSQWLTGRLPAPQYISEVREDREQRGIWIGAVFPKDTKRQREYLLLDPDRRILLSRILAAEGPAFGSGFRIDYSDWSQGGKGQCRRPATIVVSGLPYGGTIRLNFTDSQTLDSCSTADFKIMRPSGYRYQHLPAISSGVAPIGGK